MNNEEKRKGLVGAVTSDYFSAANRLLAKTARRRVVAYVESYDDVFFWRTILSALEDETHYYEVLLPTQHGKIGRGKKCVLAMMERGDFGRDMIGCVDADYDYLMQGLTAHSRQMLNAPYVYHTRAYAIENWQCWAPSLHQVAVMATLNDCRIFDFQAYMTAYSEIVYPLFLWSIWIYRKEYFGVMSIGDMNHIITPPPFTLEKATESLLTVQKHVWQKLARLQRRFPQFDKEKQGELAHELEQLGVTPRECYLFLHGHNLMQRVVVPMLTCICNRLRQQRERDIKNQSVHKTQLASELAGYTHATESVGNMLRKNTAWISAPLVHQIIEQIRDDSKPTE